MDTWHWQNEGGGAHGVVGECRLVRTTFVLKGMIYICVCVPECRVWSEQASDILSADVGQLDFMLLAT